MGKANKHTGSSTFNGHGDCAEQILEKAHHDLQARTGRR